MVLLDVFSPTLLASSWQALITAKKVTLLTHQNPDGDGISACAALAALLEGRGITVEAIYPTKSEFDIKRQPSKVLINTHSQIPDLLVNCDTANYDRLYLPEAFKNIPFMNIDHHISNKMEATYQLLQPDASSTCELLYELMLHWDAKAITPYIAQALLYGILYDTQVFQIPTHAQTLRVAADLMDAGAELFELKQELLASKTPQMVKAWAAFLNTVELSPSQKTVWASIKQEDLKKYGLTIASLGGFNNFLAQIAGVDVMVLLYETEEGKTKVSLRSLETDVNAIAHKFGGGGHKKASGILLDKSLEAVKKDLTPFMP